MNRFKKRDNPVFQFLCRQILNKECVPFLGSGISNTCEYFGSSEQFRRRKGHQIVGLKKSIASGFHNWRKQTLGELCEHYLWRHQYNTNRTAALVNLVKKLQISEFLYLKPTPAHYYIAYLVREGLLLQIITTNYDCALEWAFMESFGINFKYQEEGFWKQYKSDIQNRIFIVHDQHSCVHQHPGQQGTGDCLHLYKINGCVRALYENENNNYHEKILLTMRQLQSWRERRWAKDQFRIVLRSSTVLFSGFGSDEPQVIHTVHQILDEYSSSIREELSSVLSKFKLPPNTPVIHSYEEEPLFCQLQITNNFVQSFGGTFNSDLARKLILTWKDLETQEEGDKLSADDFWLWIYQEIQYRIVNMVLERAVYGQLAVSAMPMSRFLFERIKEFWKSFSEHVLSPKENNSKNQTLLSYWLSLLLNNGKEYTPLNKYHNAVAELLFFLAISLKKNTEEISTIKSTSGNWLLCLSIGKNIFYLSGARPAPRRTIKDYDIHSPAGQVAFLISRDTSTLLEAARKCRVCFEQNKKRTYQIIYSFTSLDIALLARKYTFTPSEALEAYRDFLSNIAQFPLKWHNRLHLTRSQRHKMRKVQ